MERRVEVLGRPRDARAEQGGHSDLRLHADADDPFRALVAAWLDPTLPGARWAVVVGGRPVAYDALDAAAAAHELLVVRTGHAESDARLADLGPVLGRLLDEMTPSQRRIGRYLLVDGLRQADAAERLGISRASVSVAHGRARIREVGLLLHAVRSAWAAGVAGRDVHAGTLD